MHPILIDFGFFQLPTYGVLLATGVIASLWTLRLRADRAGMDGVRLVDFALWLVIWALIGAKLLLVYVEEDRLPPFAGELGSVRVGDILEMHRERATKEIGYLAEAHFAGKVDYETIVVPGVPHREVVRIAESAHGGVIEDVFATLSG